MRESGNSGKAWASILGWSFGAAFFGVLSLAAILSRRKNYVAGPGNLQSNEDDSSRVDIRLGELPGNLNEEVLYTVPLETPGTAVLIEASIPTHDTSETREYELTSGNAISFYLFTKPFPDNPEVSYNKFSTWIELKPNRQFSLRLTGKSTTLSSDEMNGEITLVAYR